MKKNDDWTIPKMWENTNLQVQIQQNPINISKHYLSLTTSKQKWRKILQEKK